MTDELINAVSLKIYKTHIQDLEPTQNVELISRRILTFFNDMFLTLTARERILGITDHKSEPMCLTTLLLKKKKKAFISFCSDSILTSLLRDWNERVRKITSSYSCIELEGHGIVTDNNDEITTPILFIRLITMLFRENHFNTQ